MKKVVIVIALFMLSTVIQAELKYAVGYTYASDNYGQGDRLNTTSTVSEPETSETGGLNLYVTSTDYPDWTYRLAFFSGFWDYGTSGLVGDTTSDIAYRDIRLSAIYDLWHTKKGFFIDVEAGLSSAAVGAGKLTYTKDSQTVPFWGFGVGKSISDSTIFRVSFNSTTRDLVYTADNGEKAGLNNLENNSLMLDLTYWFL